MEHGLAADGASYCPAFALVGEATDDAFAAALGRAVTDGCPEPRPGETAAQWWGVTAMVGVATDDEGWPAHGEDAGVVRLGQGVGVLLVTDQAAAAVLTTGEWLGDAAALVLSFDLDEVAGVVTDVRALRRRARSLTVELRGASWGAVGFAVAGELDRVVGGSSTMVRRANAHVLADRLAPLPGH
jgi:hypothetical protein